MRGWLRRNVYDACSGCVVFFGISTYLSSWLVVLGDLVDVDAWGNVACVSKIDTLGLFHSLLKSPTHAYTYQYTRTHPCAYARARTLAARQSVKSILGGVSLQSVSTTWRNVWRCTSFLTISVSVVSSCRGTWGCCLLLMQVPAHSITARRLPRVCVGTGGGNPSPGRVRRLPVVVPPSSGAWGRLRGVWSEDVGERPRRSRVRRSRVDETISGLAGADPCPLGAPALAPRPRPK